MAVINTSNPFFAHVVLGAEEAAEAAGYAVIVGNSYDSLEREHHYLDLFHRHRLDGVLLAPIGDDISALDRFAARGVPAVLVDRADALGRHSSVSLDDVKGGHLAASHLLAGGARHVVFIGGPQSIAQMRDRLTGCERAVGDAGRKLTVVRTMTLSIELGRQIGADLARLSLDARPDAVVCGNDQLAFGLMQSVLEAGLTIPGDMAVIGYDDIEFASVSMIPLTSIRQPGREMGRRAAELLLRHLSGPTGYIQSVRYEPELIPRKSTHPPESLERPHRSSP
jgi:LacI family transcriptional regulator